MKDIWAKAKENQEILYFKNFQEPEITWGDALKFVYDLSKIDNENLKRRNGWEESTSMVFGSVLAHKGYFLFEESNLFPIFKGVTEFMEKVNGGNSGKDCSYYTNQKVQRGCDCNENWHIQTLRFSISDHEVFGSVLAHKGYFLFEESNLFPIFKGVTEFMEKVNGGNSGKDCSYYTNQKVQRGCDCNENWHIQTLRFSISDHEVSDHNDPNNVLYWQLLGTSYWVMNKDKEYKLEPGDLLYFNKEDSHLVWQDGPRAGIIIDDIKDRDEYANKNN